MKHSKQLTDWYRKKCWGVFMHIPFVLKKKYNNSFESYCREFAQSELYITAMNVAKHRPKLK